MLRLMSMTYFEPQSKGFHRKKKKKKNRFTTAIIFPVPFSKSKYRVPKNKEPRQHCTIRDQASPASPSPSPESGDRTHASLQEHDKPCSFHRSWSELSSRGNAMICFFARNYVSGSVLPSASWSNQLTNWGDPIPTPVSRSHDSQQPSIHPSTVLSAHLLRHPLRCAVLRAALCCPSLLRCTVDLR